MQIQNIPEIGVHGLMLRNIRRSDAMHWYSYLQDIDVIRHTSWNLSSVDDLASAFDAYESESSNSSVRLAIVRQSDDQLIGTLGFHTISDLNRTAELAYDLAPAYWGRRIMPAAVQVLCNWGFSEAQFNRIQATVLETNANSVKVLERLGFEREGYLRAYRMVRGNPGNFWMYSLLHPGLVSPHQTPA